MMLNWSDEIVWITGASSGIGRALAEELARVGAKLILTARSEDTLKELRLSLPDPERVAIAPADVTDEAATKSSLKKAEGLLGHTTIVVANAGTHVPTHAENYALDEYISISTINYHGTLTTLSAVIPDFLERGVGRIVGVSSIVSLRAVPLGGAYGASKAAMTYFLESIRFSLEPKGIKIQVVHPGFVKTPLTDKNTFEMPFRISSASAAVRIRKGIESGKDEIHFPYRLTLLSKALSILPGFLYKFIVQKSIKV